MWMKVKLLLRCTLTKAKCWWKPNTQQILQYHEAGSEAAVFRPHLSNGFSSSVGEDSYQSKRVQHSEEVHSLANHIHSDHKTHLKSKYRDTMEQGVLSNATVFIICMRAILTN